MTQYIQQAINTHGLCARTLIYKYRCCPRCRCEWPADYKSCQECVCWLGDAPLERIEWQLAPTARAVSAPASYELIGASAVVLRIVSDYFSADQLLKVSGLVKEIFTPPNHCSLCGVREHGWLVWTADGLHSTFRQGLEIEQRLMTSLPRLAAAFHGVKIRWGIWIDQYILPFDRDGMPVIGDITAQAIFSFEPDNVALSSESVYQINRHWEHFVCVPRRLLDGKSDYGFRLLGHKRPSALDHAQVVDQSPFVGRKRELSMFDAYCQESKAATFRLALVAEAGSGKTRLIKEWLRRHPELRTLSGSFSLFGGDVVSFASQLAELPGDSLSNEALLGSVIARIMDQGVQVLVIDDLHFADSEGGTFVRQLLAALPQQEMFVLLASRPSGRSTLAVLQPMAELSLKPLPTPTAVELARRVIVSEVVARVAAERSKGNPLFVEQFAAWASETGYRGDKSGPRSLHQVISARIAHLSEVRLSNIQQELRWGRAWQRLGVDKELDRLEAEIGLWLDRLETGDYADRTEAARYLVDLERVDYEIFMASVLSGKARPRSSRLREAIERLLIGSADQILVDLEARASSTGEAARATVAREAKRGGDCAYDAFNWPLAVCFYELALELSPAWQKEEVHHRLAECRRRSQPVPSDEPELVEDGETERNLEKHPIVDSLRLPEVWLRLARLHSSGEYFLRAATAAEAINDRALAAWARQEAEKLTTKHCA